MERVEVVLAAADVKGGLGTGGNHVMGATAGAVARAVARVEDCRVRNAKSSAKS